MFGYAPASPAPNRKRTTINSTNVQLLDGVNPVATTVSYPQFASTPTATIIPTPVLTLSHQYTVVIKGGSNGVKDLAGNRIIVKGQTDPAPGGLNDAHRQAIARASGQAQAQAIISVSSKDAPLTAAAVGVEPAGRAVAGRAARHRQDPGVPARVQGRQAGHLGRPAPDTVPLDGHEPLPGLPRECGRHDRSGRCLSCRIRLFAAALRCTSRNT